MWRRKLGSDDSALIGKKGIIFFHLRTEKVRHSISVNLLE